MDKPGEKLAELQVGNMTKKKHFVTDRTLQRYWRLAILKKYHSTCVICGIMRQDSELQCHHIIRRNHRVTRHDVMNGVPVCTGDCHLTAHKKIGQRIIDERLGASHMEYLYEKENVMVKDYKNALSYSTQELEKYELEKLSKIIGGYDG
jgi:hypothetical protein